MSSGRNPGKWAGTCQACGVSHREGSQDMVHDASGRVWCRLCLKKEIDSEQKFSFTGQPLP